MITNFFKKRSIEPAAHPPVFIRGVSRSGGTLMVTVLDAHPEIAMSYEIYPHLLEAPATGAQSGPAAMNQLLDLMKRHKREGEIKSVLAALKWNEFKNFYSRLARGGVDHQDFIWLLEQHRKQGRDLSTSDNRMRLMEKVCLLKMRREHKSRWGLKCSNRFEEYLSVWPSAYFINIVRDGRDVLASQMNTGSFNHSPAEVGRGWADTHRKFRQLVLAPGVNALEVYYEKLVMDPEPELQQVCRFLNVPFHTEMLSFYQNDLTIFKNPAGHLSHARISQPIDASKLGRWKTELSPEALVEFYSTAGDMMETLGYLNEQTLPSGNRCS